MTLDAPFTLPHDAPAWARQLYGWLATVQVQVDQHSVQISRQNAAIALLSEEVMSQQDELDQVVAQEQAADQRITALATDLRTQVANLQAQIDAGATTLDFSGLHAVADALDAVAPPTA